MKYTILLISLLALNSCESPETERRIEKELTETNVNNFDNPTTVGTLPDKRVIQRVKLERRYGDPHYIYFVGSDVTVNHTERQGKMPLNKVEVLIDGVKYTPSNN